MVYRLKMYSLLILMLISNILFNILLLLCVLLVFIPMMIWSKKDFDNMHDKIFEWIPTIPEPKKEE